MPHSAVFGSNCKTNGNADTDVSIHKVPSDNKRKIELENAQRPEEPRLYSLHFVPVAFQAFNQPPNEPTGADGDKRRLRENAVPTVFPHNYSKRPREAMVKRSHKSPRKETVDGIMLLCKLPDAAARMYEAVWDPADVHRRITLDHNYADVQQQLLAIKEEVSPDLDQQDPELLHIKEEQEELLTSHEERELNQLEEDDATRFPFAVVQVKSEGDEEKPPLSQLQLRQTEDEKETESPTSSSAPQMKTEADEEEPARNPNPNSTNKKSSDSSETRVADDEGDGWLSPSSDCKLVNGDDEEEELSTDTADEEDYYRHDSNVEFKHLSVHQAQDVSIKHISDVQQLLVIKEEVPSNLSPSLEQQGPGPVHIKEEQEEVLSSQEQEQLHVLEEADVTRFKDSAVKSESDQDKPPSSQLNQSQTGDTAETETPTNIWTERMKSERGGEDVGAREPARNSNPNTHFQPHAHKTSGPENQHSVNKEPESSLNRQKSQRNKSSPQRCLVNKNGFRLVGSQTPFGCSVCGERFNRNGNLKTHMKLHVGEKLLDCDVCAKKFTHRGNLKRHMKVHSQGNPYGCDICGYRYEQLSHLKIHMRVHTINQLFDCREIYTTIT